MQGWQQHANAAIPAMRPTLQETVLPRLLNDKEIRAFRLRICEAATRLFAEKGVDGVTMRELAAALKVSAMTPYRYFRDKDEILAVVRARAFERFSQAVENAADPAATLQQAIRAKREAYVRFALENPDSYRLMFDLSQPSDANYPVLHMAMEKANASMTAHAADMIAAGQIQAEPAVICHTLWALLHGIVSLKLAGKLAPHMTVERLAETASIALCRGFAMPEDKQPETA